MPDDLVKLGDLMVPSVKRMPITEFRELGLVQEINRRILHPLGLALEVTISEEGDERLSSVWDVRNDPEGMIFGFDETDERASLAAFKARAAAVDELWESRRHDRESALGFMVQPLE